MNFKEPCLPPFYIKFCKQIFFIKFPQKWWLSSAHISLSLLDPPSGCVHLQGQDQKWLLQPSARQEIPMLLHSLSEPPLFLISALLVQPITLQGL